MGKGMWLAGLSALGNSVADIGKDNQRNEEQKAAALLKQADEERMLKLRSDAQVDLSNRIAEAAAAREKGELGRAGTLLSAAMAERVPVQAEPVTALSGVSVGEGYQSPDGTETKGLTGDYEALKAQIMSAPDPEHRAVALELLDKQFANTQAQANKAVEGKTTERTPQEAIDAAYAAAVKAGDVKSAATLEAMSAGKGQRYINTGNGEIFDTKLGKYLPRSEDRTKREKEEAAAKDARLEKELNAKIVLAEMKTRAAVKDAATPAQIENVAALIAANKMAPLQNYSMKGAQGAAIMARVRELNPNYDAKDYKTMQRSEGAFAVGKQGDAVRSFNTAIAHLGTLDGLVEALGNGNIQKVNELGNFFSKQTGGVPPVEFNAAKKIVADEITKAIIGGPGALADREEMVENIKASSSPQQVRAVIRTFKELMRGQLEGLKNQYEMATGNTDFDDKFLTKASRDVAYEGHSSGHSSTPGAKPATAAPGAAKDYSNLWN